MIRLFLVALLGCAPKHAPESAPNNRTNLAYGPDSQHRLDVYHRPDGGPKQWVLLVHGGSWVSGDKGNFDTAARELIPWWLDRDYAVAAVNFRLASRQGQPLTVSPRDQAEDLALAVDWLQEHADDHGVTEPGVVAFGFSSGAHLVALLGADPNLAPEAVSATISFDVHAYDVPYALQLMEGSVVERNIPAIEHLFGPTEASQLDGSPSHHAGPHTPPALLVSAEPSPTEIGSHGYVASTASEAYASTLVGHGVRAEAVHYDGETHNSLVMDFGTAGDQPTEAVAAFLGR